MLVSARLRLLLATEAQFHSESRCLETKTQALLPQQHVVTTNHFYMTGAVDLLGYLANLLDADIDRYDNVKKMPLVKSVDLHSALIFGDTIFLSEWETEYSGLLSTSHRAIMHFFHCRQVSI